MSADGGGAAGDQPTHSAIIATLQSDIRYARQDIAELREERREDTKAVSHKLDKLVETITIERIEWARQQGAQRVINSTLGFVAGIVGAGAVSILKMWR